MSIYSANRLNSGASTVQADLSYVGTVGLSRAMHESVMNEYTLFEAVLMNDMKELSGIHEGTILESEFEMLREASVKGFFENIKAMLRKLQAKIKGVYQSVIANVSKHVLVSGKAFVNVNRAKIIENIGKMGDATIKDYRKQKKTVSDLSKVFAEFKDMFSASFLKEKSKMDKEDIQKEIAGKFSVIKDAENFDNEGIKKAIKDFCFDKEAEVKLNTFTSSDITAMMKRVSEPNSKHIKELKDSFKKTDSAIKDALKAVENTAKEAEKNKEFDIDKVRAAASAYQQLVNATSAGCISAVRFGLKQDRTVLTKFAAGAKVESALLEAMLMEEAADEIDEVFDSVDEVTPEDVAAADEAFDEAED